MSKIASKLSSIMSELVEEFSIKHLDDLENTNFDVPAMRINCLGLNVDLTCSYVNDSDIDRLAIDLKIAIVTENSPNDHIKTIKL